MKLSIIVLIAAIAAPACSFAEVDYSRQVAPVLKKYCAGCHNEGDREGGFSVQTFAAMQRGGENGAVLVPSNAQASRMIRLVTAADEPVMPPEDNPKPTAQEIDLLVKWVNEGAKGPNGAEPAFTLTTPKIQPRAKHKLAVTSLDWSPNGLLAIGTFGRVEIRPDDADHAVPLGKFPGKVTSVRFSKDGRQLVTTSGTTGLVGWAGIWDSNSGQLLHEFEGHYDVVHSAALSPDGKILATGSYDRRILLWDVAAEKVLRELSGHNGAIYDLDFSPDGTVLASASGDETVKLWRVADGNRLDTLSQPLKEQYTVRFSPDGKHIVAGGADNRIRVWRFVSRTKPRINPLVYARFGHEGSVSHLRFANDGRMLISVAEDRTVKLWDTKDYHQLHLYPKQTDVVGAVAVSPKAGDARLLIGRMDGEMEFLSTTERSSATSNTNVAQVTKTPMPMPTGPANDVKEQEPNNATKEAQTLKLPAVVHGVIYSKGGSVDEDLYRIHAKAGQTWMVEINAARQKSKLDSRVEVLTADGVPVPRVLLQAVRDSYFTFRGKDSNTSGDFRIHNWQEMELNQFLYCNGEVVRLWHYPRGPDSGFLVYPGTGNRHTYFGTSPMAHALHEPCYVVEPLPVGATPIPNGLPQFPIYFENDDDPMRASGSDSRLDFTAPSDGDYIVRVTDVREEHGEDYKYDLTIRPQQPSFKVSLGGANPTVNAGSGKDFTLNATRIDGFTGPIEVTIENLPPGFQCNSPLVIEAEQYSARGVIWAAADAKQPTEEQQKAVKVTASATINGKPVEQAVNSLGAIKIAPRPKILVQVVHEGQEKADPNSPIELTLAPGETISAEVVAQRFGYEGRISLGSHDAGRNMPFGVFVDNIGLNGLMIVAKQTRREFFITAAPFVPEQTRTFHLMTGEEGKQATVPVILNIRNKK